MDIRLSLTSAVLVLAAMGLPAAQGGTRGQCQTAGSKTLAASPQGRVYKVKRKVFGCLYRVGKAHLVAEGYAPDGYGHTTVGKVRITGKYAAATTVTSYDRTGIAVRVVNLRTGKMRYFWSAGTGVEDGDTVLFCCVSDLELKESGAVGWMITAYAADDPSPPYDPISQVWKLDATPTGPQGVMLDDGPDVRQESLALSDSTLYWTKNGQPQAAALY